MNPVLSNRTEACAGKNGVKHLIVNADDFGMTKSINEGVIKARREGIVTDVSVLAAGRAFDDAVRLAREDGIQRVGAHLSFTELDPLTGRGRIKSHKAFLLKFLSGGVPEAHMRLEFARQLNRIRGAGLEITHLDSHEQIHLLPRVFKVILDLAVEYKIPAVRFLRRDLITGRPIPGKLYRYLVMGYFEKKNSPQFEKSGLYRADRVFGFLDSGRLTEETLIAMLGSMEGGVTELVCHPGFLSPEVVDDYPWHINCEEELFALTSNRVKRLIERADIRLVDYKTAVAK